LNKVNEKLKNLELEELEELIEFDNQLSTKYTKRK